MLYQKIKLNIIIKIVIIQYYGYFNILNLKY